MKTIIQCIKWILLSCWFLFCSPSIHAQKIEDLPAQWCYAVEIQGVLCGYSDSHLTQIIRDGKELWKLNDTIIVKLSVLQGGVDMSIINHISIDPLNQKPVKAETAVTTTAEMYSFAEFSNDTAYFTNNRRGEKKKIKLSPDVILENGLNYPHLFSDFIKGNEKEKKYRVFNTVRGTIDAKSYRLLGEETLELAGGEYQTVILEEVDKEIGITSKLWLDKKTSQAVKLDFAGRLVYLAEPTVRKQITTVNLDNMLFARVNKLITNVPEISYMKVRAKIESGGEWITAEALNFPGQKFTGQVNNNFIEGIFELNPVKYNGQDAPGFPTLFEEESLQDYLQPGLLIESDHPELISKAKEITLGAKNSWEAVVRLSTWVGENIHGAVPGGTSAINTYHTRLGECGSHSRLLAAFCRAVGIPARLSVGCMYGPYLGGSFGQHAWNEVYMGQAGWIPIDATIMEYDYVDAGHIRLGQQTSFNPKEMEILEYRIGGLLQAEEAIPEYWNNYLGKYLVQETGNTFEILFHEGSLAVTIPGQPLLALNPPDEQGVCFPKMTHQINFRFKEDEAGKIRGMTLQQIIPLQKNDEQAEVGDSVPPEYKLLCGSYLLQPMNATFKVFFRDGHLQLFDPLANKEIKLQIRNTNGRWLDEFGKNEVDFEQNEKGQIIRMVIYSNMYLPKQTNL